MFICITNRKKRDVEMYDRLINLSEISTPLFLENNWLLSERGVTYKGEALNKADLQKNYAKGVNQIVMNDKNTNYTYETSTGEIIEFVGINNHLEKQIGKEVKEEKQEIKF